MHSFNQFVKKHVVLHSIAKATRPFEVYNLIQPASAERNDVIQFSIIPIDRRIAEIAKFRFSDLSQLTNRYMFTVSSDVTRKFVEGIFFLVLATFLSIAFLAITLQCGAEFLDWARANTERGEGQISSAFCTPLPLHNRFYLTPEYKGA